MFDADYLNKLKERSKTSRVYQKFQDIGLQLAGILSDTKHKALYIKLAKQYDESLLLSLAKDTAERGNVANKGAYFMKVLHERYPLPKQVKKEPAPKKKKVTIKKNPKTTKEHVGKRSKNTDSSKQGGGEVPAHKAG